MIQAYGSYIPQSADEIVDFLGTIMIYSPTFIDKSGFFADRNIDTVFRTLNAGLAKIREELGLDLYPRLSDMSDRMRTYFEADPEDKTDSSLKGRALIDEMSDLLIHHIRTAKQVSPS
jgi:hypothetical protein